MRTTSLCGIIPEMIDFHIRMVSQDEKTSDKNLIPEGYQSSLQLREVVNAHVSDADILLYGSVASGTATPESDYDLLVITTRKLSRSEEDSLDADIYQLQLDQEVVFSVSVIASDEWERPVVKVSPYYKNVTRDAIAI